MLYTWGLAKQKLLHKAQASSAPAFILKSEVSLAYSQERYSLGFWVTHLLVFTEFLGLTLEAMILSDMNGYCSDNNLHISIILLHRNPEELFEVCFAHES